MMFLIMQRNRKNEGKNGFAVSKIMVIGFLLSLLLLLSPLPHGGMAQTIFTGEVPEWVTREVEWTAIYFSDVTESPGSVYEFHKDTRRKTAIFTRAAGKLSGFAFAPWDPDRLYFVAPKDHRIFEVSLDSDVLREKVIFTHTTYIRDIAFDSRKNLYFSEASGDRDDGKIWRIKRDGTAAHFYTVELSKVGGSWNGNFTIRPDNVPILSSGRKIPACYYRVNMATKEVWRMFTSLGGAIAGITIGPDNRIYFANNNTRIYSLGPPIIPRLFSPRDQPRGLARNVAHEDSRQRIWDVGFRETAPGLNIPGTWVMPYAVRDIRFNQVNSDGLYKEYKDKASGKIMKNAPFGGGLWFRLDSSNDIPNKNVWYYSYRYRLKGAATWNEFDANISIHYVKNRPGKLPIFSKFKLGPYDKMGMKLYRFRPHQDELKKELKDLDLLAPGESVKWPKIPKPREIYRAYLNTAAEELESGKYEIRVDIYNSSGEHTALGRAFPVIIDKRKASRDTVLIDTPAPRRIKDGGFEYDIHIDNTKCSAHISPPVIGESRMDTCGFLRYDPAAPGLVRLAWKAWHPGGFGVYRFNIVKGARGIRELPLPNEASITLPIKDEVSSTDNHGELGNFFQDSPTLRLLGVGVECGEVAAYAIDLYVYAKATNGNGYRITRYDAKKILGFALAPR